MTVAVIAAVVVVALLVVAALLEIQRRDAAVELAAADRAAEEALEAAQSAQEKAEAEAEAAAEAERKRIEEEKAAREKAINDPSSITVVVNKQRPLDPIDWAPADLVMPSIPNNNGQPMRAEATEAIERMHADAVAAGAPFIIASAYRSYGVQVGLFDSYVKRDGVAAAETYSARAGHSEHQTGLVADLDDNSGCRFEACFGETAAGQWLRANSYRFGFILRYDKDQQGTVGYIYEPWHFRYVGVDVATDMHERGIKNLEDYFDLPAAPDY